MCRSRRRRWHGERCDRPFCWAVQRKTGGGQEQTDAGAFQQQTIVVPQSAIVDMAGTAAMTTTPATNAARYGHIARVAVSGEAPPIRHAMRTTCACRWWPADGLQSGRTATAELSEADRRLSLSPSWRAIRSRLNAETVFMRWSISVAAPRTWWRSMFTTQMATMYFRSSCRASSLWGRLPAATSVNVHRTRAVPQRFSTAGGRRTAPSQLVGAGPSGLLIFYTARCWYHATDWRIGRCIRTTDLRYLVLAHLGFSLFVRSLHTTTSSSTLRQYIAIVC